MKISKTQVSKNIQSSRFLDRLLGSLMIVDLPSMKNSLTLLTKSVLVPLELTAATKADIYKKTLGSGTMTLITSK